jgi:hypothetical protein
LRNIITSVSAKSDLYKEITVEQHTTTEGLIDTIHGMAREIEQLHIAIEEARSHLSNSAHGGAQYNPDLLACDSILREALGE